MELDNIKFGTFRATESEDGKKLYIQGYASPEFDDNGKKVIDEHGTLIKSASARNAIAEAMDKYMKRGGPILHNHDQERVLGKTIEWGVDHRGLWILAVMDEPITDQEKSTFSKVKSGSLKGLSIRFGSDFSVKNEKIEGEKVPVILVKTIIEITITPVPSNGEAVFESFLRSVSAKETKQNKQESKQMDSMNLTMQEYKDLLRIEAKHDADTLRLASLESDLETANKKCELAGITMEGMVANDKFEESQRLAKEAIAKVEELEAEKAELTEQINTRMEDKELTLNISEKLAKVMKDTRDVTGTGNPLDLVITDFERAISDRYLRNEDGSIRCEVGEGFGYAFEAARYIIDTKKTTGEDKVPFGLRLIAEDFATQRKVEFDVKEFHKRTISTASGMMKQNDLDVGPVIMDTVPIPLYGVVPQESINSKTCEWFQRTAFNAADFLAEGATVTSGDPTFGTKTSDVKYLFVGQKYTDASDRFAAISMLALELQSARYAMKKKTDWALMHGNSDADAYAFDGLRKQTEANTNYVYDLTAAVMTLDSFSDIEEKYMGNASGQVDGDLLPDFHFVDTRTYNKTKKLLLAIYKAYNQVEAVVGGIKYKAIEINGVLVVRDPNLIDYDATPPVFTVAKLAGGSLADDEYFVNCTFVGPQGESIIGTEASATTSSSDNSIRVAVTMTAAAQYVRVYWSETTGAANQTLIQTVENTTGAGTQNIDITVEPTSKFAQPIAADKKEGRIVSFKVGGMDGLVLKVAALEEYVEKGRVGDYKEFYLRSYLTSKFGNEKIVLETEVKTAT